MAINISRRKKSILSFLALFLVPFFILLGLATANWHAVVNPQTKARDAISRPTSEPYSGDLSIFEDPEREKNLQINRVMDILKINKNSNVADIGAGSGWFTIRAARRAFGGTIYAVEINQEYLDYISNRARQEKLSNIKIILGRDNDSSLPENKIDAVLILKTYHEIAEPIQLLKNLQKSLHSNALVGVIDRNGKGDDHGIDCQTVVKEAEQAGFTLVENYDFVKPDGMDYFLVFKKTL
jgi:SAM-dependent methyltransferase